MQRRVPEQARRIIENVRTESQKVIVGKVDVIEDLLTALLSEGHILLEGVPGVAKTTLGKTFSHVLGLEFKRIQGSPDILPADIVGTHLFDSKSGSFRLEKGPIFTNILLIDEINRNTPKANGAVLEAMQERQVTIEGETLTLPAPFMVIATESPIEFHGVFPLPEVLVDRFLFSLKVGYPSPEEEVDIVERSYSSGELRKVATGEQIGYLIELAREIYLAKHVKSYIVDLVQKTRNGDAISLGASPRATIGLSKAARARALIKGRSYVIPDDVKYLAPRVLNHRLVLSGSSQEFSPEVLVTGILDETPIPKKSA